MRHRDSAGHEGLVSNGGVQWMTAGRGVVHSEMPEQEHGEMSGYQFWLNLPARDKLCAPWYRDIPDPAIPRTAAPGGVRVRVIAGESHGVTGAVTRDATQPLLLDVEMPAGSRFAQPLPATHNAFVVVHRGTVAAAGREIGVRCLAILANDAASDGVEIVARTDAKLLVVAGRPLAEPIVQYGPFVMNTRDQILQAMADFRDGRMGGIG
jgi:redox-sensitive bicupin YhaK (pirin superfamily)